jgi:hypothetical protein
MSEFTSTLSRGALLDRDSVVMYESLRTQYYNEIGRGHFVKEWELLIAGFFQQQWGIRSLIIDQGRDGE